MSRNDAFDALLAIGAAIEPSAGQQWAETGRKMKSPDAVQKPALLQVEGDSQTESRLGQLQRRKEQVAWVIYQNAGADQAVEPARFSQDLKDAIEAVFTPAGISFETLGGRVYSAYIDGAIRRYPGDLDGVELIIVPITLLLP
jgi:hypothetical protein